MCAPPPPPSGPIHDALLPLYVCNALPPYLCSYEGPTLHASLPVHPHHAHSVARYEEIVRLLRKKIAHKSFRVVHLAATLVETLVQNCGVRFHQALASDKFMEAMKNVVKVSGVVVLRLFVLVCARVRPACACACATWSLMVVADRRRLPACGWVTSVITPT